MRKDNYVMSNLLKREIGEICGDEDLKNKIINYFMNVPGPSDENIKKTIDVLREFDDIWNEFCFYIKNGKMVDSPIKENGFSAGDLMDKEPCLFPHTAYIWLMKLRNNDQEFIRNAKEGLPAGSVMKMTYNLGKIRQYFIDKGEDVKVASRMIMPFMKDPDIVCEFEYYLRKGEFVKDNPVVVEGYTAEELYSKYGDKLEIDSVFAFMCALRHNPKSALKMIEEGFPTK